MTDTQRLNEWISEKGLKKHYISDKLGLSPGGMSKKLNGQRPFSQKEIATFRELGMSMRDIKAIFLS